MPLQLNRWINKFKIDYENNYENYYEFNGNYYPINHYQTCEPIHDYKDFTKISEFKIEAINKFINSKFYDYLCLLDNSKNLHKVLFDEKIELFHFIFSTKPWYKNKYFSVQDDSNSFEESLKMSLEKQPELQSLLSIFCEIDNLFLPDNDKSIFDDKKLICFNINSKKSFQDKLLMLLVKEPEIIQLNKINLIEERKLNYLNFLLKIKKI